MGLFPTSSGARDRDGASGVRHPRKAGAFPAGRGCHFNLSHAGDYAAAVFDEGEVGIDVEQVRRVNVNVMRRQFTAEENAYLLSEPDAFLRLWTRKESYCKAVGEGLHLPLSSFDVLEDQVAGRTAPAAEAAVRKADAGQFYLYTEVPVKGYVLSSARTSHHGVSCGER